MAAKSYLWACIIILIVFSPTIRMEEDADDDHCGEQSADQVGDFSTLLFDLRGENCYGKFLTRLRNRVEAPTMICGVKSTRKTGLKGKEYILVNLKFSNTEWVTLGSIRF